MHLLCTGPSTSTIRFFPIVTVLNSSLTHSTHRYYEGSLITAFFLQFAYCTPLAPVATFSYIAQPLLAQLPFHSLIERMEALST